MVPPAPTCFSGMHSHCPPKMQNLIGSPTVGLALRLGMNGAQMQSQVAPRVGTALEIDTSFNSCEGRAVRLLG